MTPARLALAVVGRVNKGKSSVIATLAEDDRVVVSALPGTTREVSEYPVQVDGVTLFSLIDTPGFEQAARMLARLGDDDAGRVERLRALVHDPDAQRELEEECRLLAPILAGAAILYVVDGDKPYRDNYRTEMQLLAATRQPRIAIINRSGQHREAWQKALEPYFQTVATFDAQKATLDERIQLLNTLRMIDASFQDPVRRAVDALLAEDHRRSVESAQIIAELLAQALTFTLQTRGDSIEPARLEGAFHDRLRAMEHEARDQLAHLYRHDKASWREAQELARPIFGEDLFAERTWASLGLSATQLLATYAISGAVTGGLIDAGVGAASFGAGAAIGALLGAGATALHLQQRFASAMRVDGMLQRLRNTAASGPSYRVGPIKHPNFPFVLLDRALRYHDAVRNRAHALTAAGKEIENAPAQADLAQRLTAQRRKTLVTLFTKLQRRPERSHPERRSELFREVRGLLSR
jgi:GTPase Era involved in 16S rRNA processing